MKQYLLFALAIIAFASCSSDDYVGKQDQNVVNGDNPISFNFDVPVATRATGSEAAEKLSNQFIVYGEKNETDESAPSDGNLVIKNYVVNYASNTAYTTTSNTKNWEYVGFKLEDATATIPTTNYSTNITPNSGTGEQTIKYWDYAANSYTFTAVSAKPADISAGKVKITKTTAGTTDQYDKGYTVTVTDDADLSSLYFADRVNIAKGTGKDRTATNAYGGNVTFTFRNAISQIRVGMYEKIPGYDVKVTKFYYKDEANPTFAAMTSENTANFVANVPNVSPAAGKTSVPGTFTVKYYEKNTANDAANISNHPTISFNPTDNADSKNYISLGAGVYNTTLATSSATPTYDKTGGAYTTVFPQETNNTNLKLKIDYQLTNTVTGEIINITGKTAEVPGKYLAWKPNFKYTYLFKITDNDLYPITFDAVVIEAEDGQTEYITTVSEPSITTFGVKGGKYVHDGSEYEAGSDIYATIMDGSSVVDPDGKYNVYTVTTTDATNFPITEASVAESIAEVSAKTHKVTCTAYAGTKELVTTVPGEDGNTITLSPGKAIKLSSLAAGTYAIEYVKTAATYKTVEVTYDTQAEFEAALAKMNLFNNSACTQATTAGAWAAGAKFYYKVVDNPGVYAYKVINIQ